VSLQDFKEALTGQREHPTVVAFKRDYPLVADHLHGVNVVLSADGRGRIDIEGSPTELAVAVITLTNARTGRKISTHFVIRHNAIVWNDGRSTRSYPLIAGPDYQGYAERNQFIGALNKFAADFFNG
jgi:hypothetical protein